MEYDLNSLDFRIDSLGERKFKSPVALSAIDNDYKANYRRPDEFIAYDIEINSEPTN